MSEMKVMKCIVIQIDVKVMKCVVIQISVTGQWKSACE